ncbi:hydrolase [Paenibacillus sp. FSL H8-0548]|uniref:HAD family hydrolase n=1 Tax=Paenibacillus sp. FSL H8-0548 TaxID=1920422 RepID=UPI00096EA6BC|nr:HAD family hydrolase [Paenibacillus sp. FSL H8-0548]OMF24534.1 hydrolase [Paenibacillus sp. FSL H8-0548]
MNERQQDNKPVIFLDCGDTLIDEGTEVRDESDVVISAELIPGAAEMVRTLYERGYRLAMVADGLAQSFKNMMTDHGLYDCFEVMIYSECIKELKPHPRMFKAAAAAMELEPGDYGRIVMVGNNLKRDIRGANGVGMISVYLNWSPRYAKDPADELEIPRYTITRPMELVELVEQL